MIFRRCLAGVPPPDSDLKAMFAAGPCLRKQSNPDPCSYALVGPAATSWPAILDGSALSYLAYNCGIEPRGKSGTPVASRSTARLH